MAFSKDTTEKGLQIQNAYFKITNIAGTKEMVYLTLSVFTSKIMSNNLENSLNNYAYNFIPSQDDNSVRWDKQGYKYLKNLEEYKDATDLLDEITAQ
jgi:hypothetical protein